MEQKQPPIQAVSSVQISTPTIVTAKTKPNYFTRLFSGRMNRQNYIIGSTIFVLIPLLCFLVVIFNILLSPTTFAMPYVDLGSPNGIVMPQISVISLLETPANEIWSTIGIIFIILSLPYLLSLQIKRLHDLNLSGWLWLINVIPLLFLKQMFSLTELTHPDILFFVGNFVSLISALFSFYVTLWPGTNGPNKYGDPPLPRSSFLSDIMQVK